MIKTNSTYCGVGSSRTVAISNISNCSTRRTGSAGMCDIIVELARRAGGGILKAQSNSANKKQVYNHHFSNFVFYKLYIYILFLWQSLKLRDKVWYKSFFYCEEKLGLVWEEKKGYFWEVKNWVEILDIVYFFCLIFCFGFWLLTATNFSLSIFLRYSKNFIAYHHVWISSSLIKNSQRFFLSSLFLLNYSEFFNS